nr:methionine aminopeptidase [Dermatophilus congolensis]
MWCCFSFWEVRVSEVEQKFWFNIATGQVEEDSSHSRKRDLMGPYPTREAAAGALRSARERTAAWDAEDRRRQEEEARFSGREPGEGLLG